MIRFYLNNVTNLQQLRTWPTT